MEIELILDARASARELAELGVLAEAAGIRGVWVSSLLDGRDPFTNLVPLAAATRTLRMGPIAVNPWDTHPVRIATALATLNELSAGRARIVIGGGGEALEALGLQPQRRVRAVRECVEIMRLAVRGEPVNYQGELYRVQRYHLHWVTAQPPPVYVGANMQQMLTMAGRVADGIMLSDLPPRLAQQALQTALGAAQARGSDPAFWSGAFTAWHVYADAGQARREARRWLLLRGLFRPWVLQEFLEPAEVDMVMRQKPAFLQAFIKGSDVIEGVPERVLDALVAHLTLTGSIADIDVLTERLRHHAAAGLSAIALRVYTDPAASIRLLKERVLPALSGC